jgi:uncharacterized protein YdbL (DUF1318 family)
MTPRNGRRIGSSSSSALYSKASVDAACTAASAWTSHLALETDAAAANKAEKAGKKETIAISAERPANVPAADKESKNGSSTMAAVAAAHKPERAEVNGRIAADREPWLAYVSQTAALRALTATASVARAREYSDWARKYADWAAAIAVMMIDFVATEVPGTNEPSRGAGNTLKQNVLHFPLAPSDFPMICSAEDNHVRPTRPDRANRRFPTDVALAANARASWRARLATDADNTLIRGQTK